MRRKNSVVANIFLFIMLLSLLPVEVSKNPIPLTMVTFIMPCVVLYLGFYRSPMLSLMLVSVFFAILIALISSVISQSFDAIFSLLSFFSPVAGFFLGLTIVSQPAFVYKLIRYLWVPGLLLSVAMGLSLNENSMSARGFVQASNDEYGDFLASTAQGDIFGLDLFAAFGVNSYAGIILAFCFLLLLSFSVQRKAAVKFVIIISLLLLGFYGTLLVSRSFFIGILVFLIVYIYNKKKYKFFYYTILFTFCLVVFSFALENPRIAKTVADLSSGDIHSATSNRSDLWLMFSENVNYLYGTAFQPLNLSNSASSSYHLYLMTLLGKGGLVVAFPLLLILFLSFWYRSKENMYNLDFDSIVVASLVSFIVQSLFWDIFAVQLYGHIAFFFLGLYSSRKKYLQLKGNESFLFREKKAVR